jgi:hypothetical protein
MPEEKILTKHPLGKSGKNIIKEKYEMLKRAILSSLRDEELTHRIVPAAEQDLTGKISREHQLVWRDRQTRFGRQENHRKNLFETSEIPIEVISWAPKGRSRMSEHGCEWGALCAIRPATQRK